jgi:hypothetical protein
MYNFAWKLTIPYIDKDQAKKLGCYWKPAQNSWFISAANRNGGNAAAKWAGQLIQV